MFKLLEVTQWKWFCETIGNLSFEGTNRISSCFLRTISLTKWESISMCFALAWNTWLADRYVAPKLSHHKHGGWFNLTPSFLSNDCTYITSVVAFAMDLYYALVLDWDTVACFFALQVIWFGPKKTAKPPVERRSSTHPVQSVSEKALTRIELDFMKVKPMPTVCFTYLEMRLAAVQCTFVGACKYWHTLLTA